MVVCEGRPGDWAQCTHSRTKIYSRAATLAEKALSYGRAEGRIPTYSTSGMVSEAYLAHKTRKNI